jgi:putative NADH-flavin reductase
VNRRGPRMRILVLGAGGRTGAHVVEQALGHGHDVTAFVRDASRLDVAHARLTVAVGEVTDLAAVRDAVDRQDAVIAALESEGGGSGHVHSDGTANAIRAMSARGVRRLVVMSAAGVGAESAALPLTLRLLIATPVMRGLYEDLGRMEGDVMLSDLVWTIVRPARLVEGPFTGRYRTVPGPVVPKGVRISRADAAALMLKCAEGGLFAHEAIAVAY